MLVEATSGTIGKIHVKKWAKGMVREVQQAMKFEDIIQKQRENKRKNECVHASFHSIEPLLCDFV